MVGFKRYVYILTYANIPSIVRVVISCDTVCTAASFKIITHTSSGVVTISIVRELALVCKRNSIH